MESYKQQVINFFERRTNYDCEGSHHPAEAKKLLEFIPLQLGQQVLDLATGTGLVAIDAAKKVGAAGSVIGVDISPGMLSQAQEKIEAKKINNLQLIEADAESIDFDNEQFNAIFCCSAITYFSDISSILTNCYRWLKPSGFMAFSCSYKTAYMASLKVDICQRLFGIDLPHINQPLSTPEKCRTLLQKAGFKQIEIEIERSGKYLSTDSYIMSWDGRDFFPRGNPLFNLSTTELAKLQLEYQQEVKKLVTDKGVWLDTTKLFVRSRKKSAM